MCVSIPTRNQMETVFCLFFYPDVMFTFTGSPSVSRSWLKYLPRGTGIRNVDREPRSARKCTEIAAVLGRGR